MIEHSQGLAKAVAILSERDFAASYFFKSSRREYTEKGLEHVLAIYARLTGNHQQFALEALAWLHRHFTETSDGAQTSIAHKSAASAIAKLCSHSSVVGDERVQAAGAALACRLQPEAAVLLIDCAAQWFTPSQRLTMFATDYMAHVAEVADIKKLTSYVKVLLAPIADNTEPGVWRTGRPRPRSDWMIVFQGLDAEDGLVRRLSNRCPDALLEALVEVLDQAAGLQEGSADVPAEYDASEWWLPSIEDSDQNAIRKRDYPGAVLLWARDALDALFEQDTARWTYRVQELGNGSWVHLMRLAMYSLYQHRDSANELVAELLPIWAQKAMAGLYSGLYHELWTLVNARCNDLDNETVTKATEILSSGYGGRKEDIEPEERQRLDDLRMFNMLVAFEPVLREREDLSDLLAKLQDFREKYGRERSWISFQHYSSGARRVESVPDITFGHLDGIWRFGPEKLVAELLERTPSSDKVPPSTEPDDWHKRMDNTPVVREFAKTYPERLPALCDVPRAEELDHRYVVALAYGLHDAVAGTSEEASGDCVKGLQAIVELGGRHKDRAGVWSSISLAAEDLGAKVDLEQHLEAYLQALDPLLAYEDEKSRGEERVILDEGPLDWTTQAANTVEGRALHGVFRAARRLSRKERTSIQSGVDLFASRLSMLFTSLVGAGASPVFATLFGMNLDVAYYFASDLHQPLMGSFRNALSNLAGENAPKAHQAFLQGFIFQGRPIKGLWDALRPLYEEALGQELGGPPFDRALAFHLANLWWNRDSFGGAEDLIARLSVSGGDVVTHFVSAFTMQDELWKGEDRLENWERQFAPLWKLASESEKASSEFRAAFLTWARKLPRDLPASEFKDYLKASIEAAPPNDRYYWDLGDLFEQFHTRVKEQPDELADALELTLCTAQKVHEAQKTVGYVPHEIASAQALYDLGRDAAQHGRKGLLQYLAPLSELLRDLGLTPRPPTE